MEIIRGAHNIQPRHRGCVVTIGNFDGVHRGHQRLLQGLAHYAQKFDVPATLITFEPQPREFFGASQVPPRLTRLREKVHLFEQNGLDRLVLLPFNDRTASTPAKWVADDLMHQMLGAKHVVVGDDFRFGRDREGSFAYLQEAGQRLGYAVSDTQSLLVGGDRVSSTLIREVLQRGDFITATEMLGHEYFIMGHVVYGRQLGRQLGVPTANIRLQRYKAALEGVYCVEVDGIDGSRRSGVANIGVRPTVDGKEPLLEVHVFDFQGDLYNQLLTVTFKHKLRDERAFDGIDALKAQIEKDMQDAVKWFVEND